MHIYSIGAIIGDVLNTKTELIILIAVIAACAGCAGPGGTGLDNETVSLGGVSIHPPEGEMWKMTSRDAKQVTFMRKTEKGREHSVTAFAMLLPRPKAVTDGKSLLKYALQATMEGYRDKRYTLRDSNAWLETGKNGERAVVKFSAEDRGVPWNPGEIYIMSGEDAYFLHPNGKTLLLLAESQRFPAGATTLDLGPELAPFKASAGN